MREFQLLQQLHHVDLIPGRYTISYPPTAAPNGLYREYDYSEGTLTRAKEAIIEAWRRFAYHKPEECQVEIQGGGKDGVCFTITVPLNRSQRKTVTFHNFKMAAAMAVFVLVNPSSLAFSR
jgi:hypothetical protein